MTEGQFIPNQNFAIVLWHMNCGGAAFYDSFTSLPVMWSTVISSMQTR